MTDVKDQVPEENFSPEGKNRLRTDAIAGAGKAEPEPPLEEAQRASKTETRRDDEHELEPLFTDDSDREFRNRWRDIQSGFVDEPRVAVEQADELVAQLMQRLAQSFSEQRSSLEHQWDASDKVSTEELRVALKRYRSFFERLLSV
jgi:hypothetical protein